MKPIKAKINSTGEVVEVRPYLTEIYDFIVCCNGGIMGELYMRSELTFIGDNELDFVSLVKKMREAQAEQEVISARLMYIREHKGVLTDKDFLDVASITNKVVNLEDEVDELLKEMEE